MFSNSSAAIKSSQSAIIPFEIIEKKSKDKKKNIIDLDNNSRIGKIDGKNTEVFAFRTQEEIDKMLEVLNNRIEYASDKEKRWIAYRNKMLFVIGINIGIRASDLRLLQFKFFFEENGEFKDSYSITPIKTRKYKKPVRLYFNKAVRNMLSSYIQEYPYKSLDDYLFASREGDEPIEVCTLWRIIKSTASTAGIKQNIGSHSLRKTFGFWCWHNAEDKNKALVILQQAFNHSDTRTTAKYIGILNEEIEDLFNSIELGLDMI